MRAVLKWRIFIFNSVRTSVCVCNAARLDQSPVLVARLNMYYLGAHTHANVWFSNNMQIACLRTIRDYQRACDAPVSGERRAGHARSPLVDTRAPQSASAIRPAGSVRLMSAIRIGVSAFGRRRRSASGPVRCVRPCAPDRDAAIARSHITHTHTHTLLAQSN